MGVAVSNTGGFVKTADSVDEAFAAIRNSLLDETGENVADMVGHDKWATVLCKFPERPAPVGWKADPRCFACMVALPAQLKHKDSWMTVVGNGEHQVFTPVVVLQELVKTPMFREFCLQVRRA